MITFYQILHKDESITDCYIGSTIRTLEERASNHKHNCHTPSRGKYNSKLYTFIRNAGGFDNFRFKILNQIVFYDETMRLKQEQVYIDLIKPTLNKNAAYISQEDKDIADKTWQEYRNSNDKIKGVVKVKNLFRAHKTNKFGEKTQHYFTDLNDAIKWKKKNPSFKTQI